MLLIQPDLKRTKLIAVKIHFYFFILISERNLFAVTLCKKDR